MTYVTTRDVPWAKLGTKIDHDMSAAEAAELTGMDFEVTLEPAGFLRDGQWHEQQDRFAIVRDDTGDFFNFCTSEYAPVQYSEAFDFMDEINPRYVAAGTMRGGRQAFMVAKLPERSDLNLMIKGQSDPHDFYVILRASHDMSKSIEVAVMTLRSKCMNALTLKSFTANAPQRWSIRHTKSVHEKLSQAQEVMKKSDAYRENFRVTASKLSDIKVADEEAQLLISSVIPKTKSRDTKQIPAIMQSFSGSDTNGFPGTGWGLVNAINEYFEHGRDSARRTDESRFKDDLDGATHKYTNRVAELLLNR